jgi:quercetin dioxygenase-like cupin family protein
MIPRDNAAERNLYLMETTQQSPCDFAFKKSSDMTARNPEPGLTRRLGAFNDKLSLAEHRMEKSWMGALHSHPHDQIAYVVRGHLKVIVAGTAFEMKAGESFVVRGGVDHQATALEESVVIDVFTPCRQDYV